MSCGNYNDFPGADAVGFAKIATVGTTDTIVAAVPGKRIRVLAYVIGCGEAGANALGFASNVTPLTGTMETTVESPGVAAAFCPVGHFETAPGEPLVLGQTTSAAAQGHLTYCLIG